MNSLIFSPLFVLAQGIRDLFWLPVEQYRKDGRIVRGLQRGAASFTMSTAMSMLELTNRVVQGVQVKRLCRNDPPALCHSFSLVFINSFPQYKFLDAFKSGAIANNKMDVAEK